MSTDEASKESPAVILVGEVVKAHGIRGEVAVKVLSENPERFTQGARLLVGTTPRDAKSMSIVETRGDSRVPERILVRFADVLDRSSAEGLRGKLIFVPVSEVAAPDEDAYWEHEIVGSEVVDLDGERVGTLKAVHPRTEQDLWEVDTGSGSAFIPAAKDLIVSVDTKSRRIVIDPPEGLFNED